MKLSKKNRGRQRMIDKALLSGKALGGLLAGIATVFTGCRDNSPRVPMGSYPCPPELQTNAVNETGSRNTSGDVTPPEGKDAPAPQSKPNAANEKRHRNGRLRGKYLMSKEDEE